MSKISKNASIHHTAIIGSGVSLGDGVIIGPYCVLEGSITIGSGVKLQSHVCIAGNVTIGDGTEIFPFASLGHKPQDLKYSGEDSEVVIGRHNTIREYVTIQPGTASGIMKTVIGDNCLLMVGSHIAHDCIVGNSVIIANNGSLAGHVVVEDHVIIGGLSGVHQFVQIGKYAMIGGMTAVRESVAPYSVIVGAHGSLRGVNIIGMKRANFSKKDIEDISLAFRKIFFDDSSLMEEKLSYICDHLADSNVVLDLVHFIKASGSKPICTPAKDKKL